MAERRSPGRQRRKLRGSTACGPALVLLALALLPTGAQAQLEPVGRRVAAVRVDTTLDYLLATAEAALELAPGDLYSVDAVRASIQNLFALGSVADVRVEVTEARTRAPGEAATGVDDPGIEVAFVLEPQVRLWDVEFTGTLPWRTSRLRRALTLRDGQPLDAQVATVQARRLQQALADDGFLLAEVRAIVEPLEPATRGRLRFDVKPGSLTRLEQVRLEGDTGLPEVSVREALQLPAGSTYRPDDLERGIETLVAALLERHYFFHSVRVLEQSFDLAANAMFLTLEVEAGPRVQLDIGGLGRPEHELHDVLAIFEFATVDDWALKEARGQLVRYLQERGHWRPLVSYTRQRDDQGRNVEVSFRVLAGERHRLAAVRFEGNAALSDGELLAAIRTRPAGFLDPRRFLSEWWEGDQAAALTAYRRQGYREARVVAAPVGLDEAGKLVATMVIDEGPQTRVSEVRIEVDASPPTPGIDVGAWASALQLRPDGPYDAAAVRRDADRLRGLLANVGYPRALVESESTTAENGTVSVVQRVHPGERSIIRRVLVAGNQDTRAEVIRRELAFAEGSPYSFSDVLDTQSRLYRLGLFDDVEVRTAVPDDLAAHPSVVVRVHEAPPMFVSYGAGFDTEEKVRGTFAVGHNNLFGRDQELSLSTRLSVREQRVRLLFQQPYFAGTRTEATTSAFYTTEVKSSFDLQRFGGSFQLLVEHAPQLTGIARLAFRDVSTFNVDIDPTLLRRQDRDTRVGSVGYALIRDTRPDPADPHSGGYHTLDVDLATKLLGSDTSFATVFGRSFWYRELAPAAVLAVAGRGGVQLPFGDTVTVPLPERLFSGGSTTLRGFPLDRAGPVDSGGQALGGEALLVANIELRFRVRGAFGAVAFLDVGNVFAKPSDISLAQVREMAGLGIRYSTPVGPIRLDFARLLDRRNGEDRWQLFFSVGQTF